MNTCPICFEHIETKDLLYETLFHNDREGRTVTPEHHWIKKTPLGMFFDPDSPAFCIRHVEDTKTGEVFGKAGAQIDRHLMFSRKALMAQKKENSQSDIELFLKGMKAILKEQGNEEEEEMDDQFDNGSVSGDSFFSVNEKSMTDHVSDAHSASDEDSFFSNEEVFRSDYKIAGRHDVKNCTYTVKVDRCIAFQVVPCCPHCRVHLPKGWKEASHYIPIGFVSPRNGGKTTIIESLVSENLLQFNQFAGDLFAYSGQDEEFSQYYREKIVKRANELVYEKRYPDGTEAIDRPPVFFVLEYKQYTILIGLFDIAGEILENLKVNNPLADYLIHMKGIVCLVDPNCLRIKLRPAITEIYEGEEMQVSEGGNESKKYEICSIEEQGRLQRNSMETITIEELLKEITYGAARETAVKKYNGANYELTKKTFLRLISVAVSKNGGGKNVFSKAHLAMTIMKSDELERTPEIQSLGDAEKRAIFERPYSLDAYLKPDQRLVRNREVTRLFDKYFFHEEQEHADKNIFTQFFGSVSWHCISAVGCDKTIKRHVSENKAEFYYDGEFNPIRVIEPILEIVFRQLGEIQ